LESHHDRGLSVNPDWILETQIGREPAYHRMKQFLEKGVINCAPTVGAGLAPPVGPKGGTRSCPIDALFCFNDLMAIGALHAIREARLSVPDDIAVVGYDDIEEARFQAPPLTSVHLKMYEIGEHAIRLLHEQIQTRTPKNDIHIQVIPSLIERASTIGQR
jgi:DNA-binding LacI/PurR family transcriptional regulator